MKHIYIFLLFSFCIRLTAQVDIPELDRLIKYGEVETLDITFRNISHSNCFIQKFHLNEQELAMIGYWTENYTVKLNQTSSNAKILGINIYPNRIMAVNIELQESNLRTKVVFYFLWKVTSKNLLIKPMVLMSEEINQLVINNSNIINISSQKYYNIAHLYDFNKAYVLREQFDFSVINEEIRGLNFKLGKDSLRYRILYEHAMPSIYERIGSNENLKNFLLNPVYTDYIYYKEIKKSHSISYKTEYNQWLK